MVGRGLAPATGFAVNSETGTDGSLHTKNNASVGGDDSAPRCRGGFPRPPVDFDVICPSVTRFARATSPTSGEVCGTVKTVPYGL